MNPAIRVIYSNQRAENWGEFMALGNWLFVSRQVRKVQFDSFSRVSRCVFNGFSIGNAARQRRHNHCIAAIFVGNEVNLVGKTL
jgi:hypothetical protein